MNLRINNLFQYIDPPGAPCSAYNTNIMLTKRQKIYVIVVQSTIHEISTYMYIIIYIKKYIKFHVTKFGN